MTSKIAGIRKEAAMREFKQGQGPTRVVGEARLLGQDMVVHLYGGTAPHIGAIAIGLCHPNLKDATENSATVSVYTMVGHKDDLLARAAAYRIAKALKKTVVVVAGFHLDNITGEQIEQVVQNSDLLVTDIVKHYSLTWGERDVPWESGGY